MMEKPKLLWIMFYLGVLGVLMLYVCMIINPYYIVIAGICLRFYAI